jgi:uncharacterized protein YqgC (DUF456 family)
MLVSAILLTVVILVIAFIARAWFQRNPASWSRYAFLGLAVLWLLGLFWTWRAYH